MYPVTNPFTATNPNGNCARAVRRRLRKINRRIGATSRSAVASYFGARECIYPVVPANYPNRAVRRAVQQGRLQRLPGEWREYLTVHPQLRLLMEVR